MRLLELRIDGFGKLVDRTVVFDPRFTVVHGPNEAGKSTFASAILATLFGFARGERELWRPWSGARYATTLVYALADGREFEVRREFERDAKGVNVYDASGNDLSVELTVGKNISPGYAHLGIPLDVFVNASYVAQGEVEIDGARAERISNALAQALDGGPREDAALGALRRLDEALATHVGKKRATVNAPLRRLHDEIGEAQARAEELRARLRMLDDLRSRLQLETERVGELELALREHQRRGKALRAQTIRTRLDALREIRDDLAALQAERARYDDVVGFPSERVADLDARFHEWRTLATLAASHAQEAAETRLTPALLSELDACLHEGGGLDDAVYAKLERVSREAKNARDRATFAANQVQSAQRAVDGGSELFGAAIASAGFVSLGAAVLAVAHDWWLAAVVGVLALALLGFAWSRWRRRRRELQTIGAAQRAAEVAVSAEAQAASIVAATLEPLGVRSLEELAKQRARTRELTLRRQAAERAAARAAETRTRSERAARAFDELARELVVPSGSREANLSAAKAREARKRARGGIEVRLSMLGVRRSDVLGAEDESALDAELAELLAAGVAPAPLEDGVSTRAFEVEWADLDRRLGESRTAAAAYAAELRAAEVQLGDLAGLDERVEVLRSRARRLERFEAAVSLARATIDQRTREAHRKFARRLADYASATFSRVTGGRYADVRVDPTTLTVRVRAPETGAIVDVDRLSAGTREQAYLVVRLAMARMFAEGLETAPLLLDDPFAYWDEARIARSLPILQAATEASQTVLFTTSRELAAAVASRGARLVELDEVVRDGARPTSTAAL